MLSGVTACSLRSRCPPGPPLLARETRTRNLPVHTMLTMLTIIGLGGPDRVRTDDLLDANQALSQLSYGPFTCPFALAPKNPGPPGIFESRIDYWTFSDPSNESVDLWSLRKVTLLRKEVIQPQVLLQLPCYDFTPITKFTIET